MFPAYYPREREASHGAHLTHGQQQLPPDKTPRGNQSVLPTNLKTARTQGTFLGSIAKDLTLASR